jgi:hypothetical protein
VCRTTVPAPLLLALCTHQIVTAGLLLTGSLALGIGTPFDDTLLDHLIQKILAHAVLFAPLLILFTGVAGMPFVLTAQTVLFATGYRTNKEREREKEVKKFVGEV